jgi:murein DD-endopeptidase MepM/ murein hydrolase activator NlpD
MPGSWIEETISPMFCVKHRLLVRLVAACLFLFGAAGESRAQIRKACGNGLTLKLSAAAPAQGSLLLAEVLGPKGLTGVKADFNGREIPLWSEGEKAATLHGLIGVDLEMKPGKYEWKVSWEDAKVAAVACSVDVRVRAGKFLTEHLKVEKQFVEPNPEQEKRAAEDQKKMKAIYDTVTPERLWQGKFRIPLNGVTTGGNFGRRRVLNGQSRSPHAGVDFPAASGTPVFAAQAGKVVVAEGLYYSGNTVVIDHGFGIYTMYAHLSEIEVHEGDAVKLSDKIGKVGATGRVTGPHLHWGLTVDHARVNALNITQREP